MAMKSVASGVVSRSWLCRLMEGSNTPMSSSSFLLPRYFSDGKGGRILSEEERAKETVYIQKMERERMEKMKKKMEKEKGGKGKEGEGGDKKFEGGSQ